MLASNLREELTKYNTINRKNILVRNTPTFCCSISNEVESFVTLATGGPWVKMEQTLKEGRYGHVSFLVLDELVNCH
jgi:hypothetical protein